jgi:hypothetical protein
LSNPNAFGILPGVAPQFPGAADHSTERRYLPTLADLIDRMQIVQMKMIFITDRRAEYAAERDLLLHDIGVVMAGRPLTSRAVWAISVLQLANRFIWENETRIRDGSSDEPDAVQLQRLKATHAINGVRNTAKNVISAEFGGRQDYKIDSMAAELPAGFGQWNIFQ